jgi:hypothetical protein
MQITVQNVQTNTINKGGKSRPYGEAKVEYLNERGETKTWTLRSFTNPSVFKTLSEAPAGTTYEITTTKNDKDFTEWSSATPVAASAVGTSSPSKGTPVAARSTYETPEERAIKQRLIVRQSSLAQALVYTANQDRQGQDGVQAVLDIADRFSQWVYEAPSLTEMTEDIPF